MVAEYSTQTASNPTISYLTSDNLGSPRITTDTNGQVVSRRDFRPFGEEISRANYGTDSIRQRFTGYEKDIETGLDFAEARYYNNQHGRFTAVDPLLASGKSANPQTFNRYVYVANNPINATDPSGLNAIVAFSMGLEPLGAGTGEAYTDPFLSIPVESSINVGSWSSLTSKQQELFNGNNQLKPIELAPSVVNADGTISGGEVISPITIPSALLWTISAGIANAGQMPSPGSAFLSQSQLTTFIGVTSMWAATGVIDKIDYISDIIGDVAGDAFRLRGAFKEGGGEFIRDKWKDIGGNSKENDKYTESRREGGFTYSPNGQFTMTKDLKSFDSDVDYHSLSNVIQHNKHENSDIRQNGFLHRHLNSHIERYGSIPIGKKVK